MSAARQIMVYTTVGDEQTARQIARALVDEHLVACVNFFPIQSVYRWEDRINEDREVILIAKTTGDRVAALTEAVCRLHSYDCPAVVSLPVTGGNSAFLEWVAAETAG